MLIKNVRSKSLNGEILIRIPNIGVNRRKPLNVASKGLIRTLCYQPQTCQRLCLLFVGQEMAYKQSLELFEMKY